MAKSKKFKPVLKASEIRCGVTYLRIAITDTGDVNCSIYTPTKDPYMGPSPFKDIGKSLMVDYISQTVGHDTYHSEDNFVSDMIGIYGGRRQTSSFSAYVGSTKLVLYSKGLFKFSNKLLEKTKSFENDTIKALEFLNPEKFLTASERSIILYQLKKQQQENTENYLKEYKIMTPKYEYYKL